MKQTVWVYKGITLKTSINTGFGEMVQQATNLVEFNIAANCINLATKDIDFSYSAEERVNCAYEGGAIVIGFKSTFLVDILSNIETPSVVVELADSTRAGVFKPLYDEPQSANTLMLLMPMMINS